MATDDIVTVHPGDILQDSAGLFYLAAETHSWGVGAVQRCSDKGEVRESYFRLKPDQFVVVGVARTLPEEVAQARRDSIKLASELAREARDPDDLTPEWDVEVRFNGRTTGSGQSHRDRVRADSYEEALGRIKLPVMAHGGSLCIVGATVDEVRK